MGKIIKYALINSLGTAIYIVLIVSLIFTLGDLFPGDNETILAPISMLMLFVFSAALTGTLVFGRPIMWYLDGKKKESILLLFYTLEILLMILLIIFMLLVNLIR